LACFATLHTQLGGASPLAGCRAARRAHKASGMNVAHDEVHRPSCATQRCAHLAGARRAAGAARGAAAASLTRDGHDDGDVQVVVGVALEESLQSARPRKRVPIKKSARALPKKQPAFRNLCVHVPLLTSSMTASL
jgi:hypothetical protein